MMDDYRYLLFSHRFGRLGQGDNLEDLVGLAMVKAEYEDTIYFLDQRQGTFTTLERRQYGVGTDGWKTKL